MIAGNEMRRAWDNDGDDWMLLLNGLLSVFFGFPLASFFLLIFCYEKDLWIFGCFCILFL